MTPPWEHHWAGRLDRHTVHSPALEGNHLGDPADRPLWVYVPPGYDGDPGRRYPVVYVIQGYGGFISTWANRSWNRPPYPEEADRLFAAGGAPPCLLVFVDAWTSYGGSQFVDSAGTAATTPICATTWCPTSTPGTGRSTGRPTGPCRESRAADSGP